MLKRDSRIPRKLFPLLRKNKQYEGEFFGLRATYLSDSKITNQNTKAVCVCIIPKKTVKLATDRNKIKRRVYSILFRSLVDSKKIVAIQVFPKKEVVSKKYSALEQDLLNTIKNNNLL